MTDPVFIFILLIMAALFGAGMVWLWREAYAPRPKKPLISEPVDGDSWESDTPLVTRQSGYTQTVENRAREAARAGRPLVFTERMTERPKPTRPRLVFADDYNARREFDAYTSPLNAPYGGALANALAEDTTPTPTSISSKAIEGGSFKTGGSFGGESFTTGPADTSSTDTSTTSND